MYEEKARNMEKLLVEKELNVKHMLEEVKKIYNWLEDEESKDIYMMKA